MMPKHAHFSGSCSSSGSCYAGLSFVLIWQHYVKARPQIRVSVEASVQLREREGEGESDRRLNDRLRANALTYRHASCIIKRMSGIRNEDRDGTIHGNVVLVAIILHLQLALALAELQSPLLLLLLEQQPVAV